jgi:hypothetical protein
MQRPEYLYRGFMEDFESLICGSDSDWSEDDSDVVQAAGAGAGSELREDCDGPKYPQDDEFRAAGPNMPPTTLQADLREAASMAEVLATVEARGAAVDQDAVLAAFLQLCRLREGASQRERATAVAALAAPALENMNAFTPVQLASLLRCARLGLQALCGLPQKWAKQAFTQSVKFVKATEWWLCNCSA